MPYPITAFETGPGFARLQLGANDEFTILSASVLIGNPEVTPYVEPWFVCDDPSGGAIHRQYLGSQTRGQAGYFLATDAADRYVDTAGFFGFPQDYEQYHVAIVSLTIPPVTVTPGCTVGFYCSGLYLFPGNDPMGFLQAEPNNVQFPHLWVEDTNALGRGLGDVGNPLLLGIGS